VRHCSTSVVRLDALGEVCVDFVRLALSQNTNSFTADSECNGGRTIFGGEMQIVSDCYGYMRLTHVSITRRRTADDVKSHKDSVDVHDGKVPHTA